MSLFDMFTSNTPAAPAAPAAPAPTTPGNIPDGTNPSATADPGNPAPAVNSDSPLDQFKSLWDPIATDGKEGSGDPAPLDPARLQEIISKADFTKSLSQDKLGLIAAGGDGAISAFTEALNAVGQQVLMQSTMAANQMQEQAIKAALDKYAANLPNAIKSQSLTNNLNANPVFSNPAVTPIIEAVKAQLVAKNPNATADQLTEMAQNFVTVMGEAFSPKPASNSGDNGFQNMDWDKFLNG